jgi:hypothetical protein
MAQIKLLHLFLTVIAAVNVNVSALAQTDESKIPLETLFILNVRPACERVILQFTTREDQRAIHAARPVDEKAVCTCLQAKFLADPRLAKYWGRQQQVQTSEFSTDNLKTYTIARMVASGLECLTLELNLSLDSMSLPP